MILPKYQTKNIKVGDYTKKVKYANRLLWNVFDCMMQADGYFLFKKWGKGTILFQLSNVTTIGKGTLDREFNRGARLISIEFDDKKTSYFLKGDIIDALKAFYKSGGWNKGVMANKHVIEPKDVENLTVTVKSRWFPKK